MIRYFLKRILMLVPVILAVSLLVFTLMDLIPGDAMSGYNLSEMTEEEVAELRKSLGLDDPLLVRYGRYMFRLIQGDLGISDINGLSVWDTYMSRLPNTLLLAISAFCIGVLIAIPMGVRAARHAGTVTDNLTTAATMIGMSMPGFWLGLLLILFFSYQIKLFPTGGFNDGFRSLVLPALAASAGLIATATRQTRSSMLEVLRADYLRTARAKGVPEKVVIRKHALGNALIPIVTSVGIALGHSLAGSAVIETVFAWPGAGRLVVESVFARDATATTGYVILTTIIYCLVQLAVDLVYAIIDPRIKAQYVRAGKPKKRKRKAAAAKAAEPQPVELYAGTSSGDGSDTAVESFDGSSEQGEAALGQAGGAITVQEPVPAGVVFAGAGATSADNNIGDSTADVSSDDEPDDWYEQVEDEDVGAEAEIAAASGELLTRKYRKRSQAGEVFHHLRSNKGAVAGMLIISTAILLFIIAQFIPFEKVTDGVVLDRFSPPSLKYPFGTDNMGRSLFIRVIYATKFSLPIGFGATFIAALIGVLMGSHAAYYGGIVDDIIMRISDTLASIPGLITGMVIISALGRSLQNLILAVGLSAIPIFVRTSRASMLTVRGNEFLEAARAIGLSNFRIIFTQALPNGLAPIMISFSIALGNAILVSASLSYLGFGIPVPNPEWGALVSAGRDTIRNAPWLMTFPGLFIMITVMGFNMLGDGLRDALDPKLKK